MIRRFGDMAATWQLHALLLLVVASRAEHVRDLEVFEGAPVGTKIGFIGDGASVDSGPPYLIVPVGSAVDSDLSIDQTTGEIRTKVPLDRETRASYSLVAIPISGDNIRVLVKVLDENDNAPTFPTAVMSIEFPENTPRDVKRTLNPARDLDLDIYNTQRYNIVSGNVNNAFRLSSHRERDGVLYLDLQINGFLDRETTAVYSLVIEALDGGTPPLRGEMTVNITIQDVNDNQPIFNQSRYFAVVPENATVGTSVLQVFATDNDAGENGQIEYSINRRQSDRDNMFRIDPITGQIAVNKPLDFEAKEMHELVVVARDHGLQPLETTAFVSIRVTDVNDNQPTINVIFLSDDATPKISESAQPGEFVARISVNDPDSKAEYSNINVTLTGGDGRFGLTTRDNIIYLVIVSLPLDRELQPNYTLNVVATDTGTPPLHASRTINLMVTDINDNAPEFIQEVYHANVMEVSDPGTSVIQVLANDKDEGNNSAITYTLVDTPDTHSSWFQIDSRSGLVTTRAHVDCETDPVPQLTVIATDSGFPPLSSSATVLVTIHDVNDNEPIFDQSFYNVSVAENEVEGRCILKMPGKICSVAVCKSNSHLAEKNGEKIRFLNFPKDNQLRKEWVRRCHRKDKFDPKNKRICSKHFSPDCYEDALKAKLMNELPRKLKADCVPSLYLLPEKLSTELPQTSRTERALIKKQKELVKDLLTTSSIEEKQIEATVADLPSSSKETPYEILLRNYHAAIKENEDLKKKLVDNEALLKEKNLELQHIINNYEGRIDSKVQELFCDFLTPNQINIILKKKTKARWTTEEISKAFTIRYFSKRCYIYLRQTLKYPLPGISTLQRWAGNINLRRGLLKDVLNVMYIAGKSKDNFKRIVVLSFDEVKICSTYEYDQKEDEVVGPHAYMQVIMARGLFDNWKQPVFIAFDTKVTKSLLENVITELHKINYNVVACVSDCGESNVGLWGTLDINVDKTYCLHPVTQQKIYFFADVPHILKLTRNWLLDTGFILEGGIIINKQPLHKLIEITNSEISSCHKLTPLHLTCERAQRQNVPLAAQLLSHTTATALRRYLPGANKELARNVADFIELVNSWFDILNSYTPAASILAKQPYGKHLEAQNEALDKAKRTFSKMICTSKKSLQTFQKGLIISTSSLQGLYRDLAEEYKIAYILTHRLNQDCLEKFFSQVSATDPDCGVNAMVNYTLGEGFGKQKEFEIRSATGEICISSSLDYENRNVYELPVIATDRGGLSTTAMVKIQVTDVNDNRPTFYPREYNVSLREGGASSSATTPVVVVAATDPDSGRYGSLTYRIVSGNDAGLFRIDRSNGEIFVSRPNLLSTRSQPYHHLNISASDGGGLKSAADAEVFISVIDSAQRPPIFEQTRYTYSIREDAKRDTFIGAVKATVMNSGHHIIRYSIYSGDPDAFFRIDASTGSIRTASNLDHETRANVLLNIQATSGNPPAYGHTQVNIEIEDVNDNSPEFESNTVRISVPENVEIGTPIYAAHARDKDSGTNGVIHYKLSNNAAKAGLFAVDSKQGSLTIIRHLDYEAVQRHSLVITASDTGVPPLSANLTVLVEVQDVNDNPPVFERTEYNLKVLESLPVNSQILQVTAVDLDTGNNARLTYRLLSTNTSGSTTDSSEIFGIFPNSGWIYLHSNLDREQRERHQFTVVATDNGTPSQTATARVVVKVLDANDNDPVFVKEVYDFRVEENVRRGASVGVVSATDADVGANAAVRYFLIPSNTSFQIHPVTGEIVTKDTLDRELKEVYDLVAEARDQGTPPRSSRVTVKIKVLDVNDNAPEIVDPQEDVVSVREEQPPNTEVVRVRAVDADDGNNSSVTYSILKSRDSDGYGIFSIDPISGTIRTKMVLDHEEKTIYRLAVAATDNGYPPKQTVRMLRVEVLDLNDNRPTFTSSSLIFKVREDVRVGHIVGTVATTDSSDRSNVIPGSSGGHITYTLNSLTSDQVVDAFDIDRSIGSLIVARELDRELQSEYRLEVRALDTSAVNNPQSSAVTVRIDIIDVNDNAPQWSHDPVTILVGEDTEVGSSVYNFTAIDMDSTTNGELRYSLLRHHPNVFSVDSLTGTLVLTAPLDYETLSEYTLIVKATDQCLNISERLSTSLTARVIVTDANDNSPQFVIPTSSNVFISDSITVGEVVTRVLAVDKDSGDNGRVTYVIASGNEDNRFALGYDTGIVTLTKPLTFTDSSKVFTLNITSSDHGTPTRQAHFVLKLSVQGSSDNPPRFLYSEYQAKVAEDVAMGTYVAKVTAKSGLLEGGGNLTYYIPNGIADDAFAIDSISGIVTTRSVLDHEMKNHYLVSIYVTDSIRSDNTTPTKTQFDVTILSVMVTDVNDHAPEFRPGSCSQLSIPENNDLAVVHTIVAMDMDSGNNGEVTYSITGGNTGNKFSIDMHSGELTARSLDRESHSRYHLSITAQDHGNPPLQGSCNITVRVEDQNDNDPKFDNQRYLTTIPEDVPTDTSVLKVHASDADIGVNAKIIYSLANESQWLFRIDNKTGVITTTGQFDRERQSVYNFLVVASDSGRYDARSQKVPVIVQIGDINDNKPIFNKYPFKEKVAAYIQPGHTILKVGTTDADQGTNSEIVYSLVNDGISNKFRINPNTGILSATQSLASENGKTIYLNVIATDKGNPPQSSTGLIEISVGDIPENYPHLRFQNNTYIVNLIENAEQFRDVLKVSAVRTDGRRQKILYSFGTGNEANIFVINSESGIIQVRNPKYLDYELRKEIRLVVEARTEGNPNLHGFCEVLIKLIDQNDNAPTFTQQEYTASVWEGNSKGAFVLQVVAFDADEDRNSRVLYHIVDGNHDNAFMIEPAFSGILKTNIVLDREIRDTYRLTVIATDEGVPQMTGTTRVRINIVDVNDNQPTFPPHSIITVSEVTEVGTVLTTVTANDVDTNPALTYSFVPESDNEVLKIFSIDRFSGKVILKKPLDFETRQEYSLKIAASDTAHMAKTTLTIRITDVNDNPPVFSHNFYHTTLPEGNSNTLVDLLTVNATDADFEDNAKIKYSLFSPVTGFLVGEYDGTLRVNLSSISSTLKQDLQITLLATDSGNPPLHSSAAVRIKVNSGSGFKPQFHKRDYRVQIPEDTPKGTIVLNLGNSNHNQDLHIVEGNEDGVFEITNPSGVIVVVKPLDREVQASYNLKLQVGDHSIINSSAIEVFIVIDDVNDNAPVFKQTDFEISISESTPVGTSIMQFFATDSDLAGSDNSEIVYDITSGNDNYLFELEEQSGILKVNRSLDYDHGVIEHNFVIRACDCAVTPICTLNGFHVILEDENDNVPRFPVPEYLEFIGENEPIGTAVFTAHATDLDKGIFGSLNYSIVSAGSNNNYPVPDDTWKLFHVDSNSGLITTNVVFDYEQKSRYVFTLKANDIGDKAATVKVRIEIESRDEFHPQFTERTYKFVLATPPSGSLPVGYVIGHVTATDRDKGPDGRVVYQLTTQNQYFRINRTTGAILIKKKFNNAEALDAGKDISLVVTASSGRQGSLTNMTVVEVTLDPLADPGTNLAVNRENNTTVAAANGGIADWALGLLISFLLLLITFGAVFVFLHMRNKRNKKVNKPNLSNETVSTSNNYVDPSAFDTIPIRGGVVSGSNNNQFAPPKYDEIPPYGPSHAASSNSGAATTSELSGSEQSGSSGRGSAEDGEDGEDEEIRMINEGPLQRDSGIHRQNEDDDNLSDVSVRNTQEYLARLGIVNNNSTGVPQTAPRMCGDPRTSSNKDTMHHHQSVPLDGLHMFEEHGNAENDITNLIYAKLNDVTGSDRASSTGEGGAVATTNLGGTMDHVMAIGGYGDVPTVTHQPSMNGSLSSIVHSEEELAGSYNWDYLLDWGPQYQPLAHVFSEIARLKDDTASVQSATSGNSSIKSKNSVAPAKNVPPPLITSVAPRSIAMPVLNARGGSSHHIASNHNQVHMLPRSPINHDASGATFTTSTAMSPSFSPSLSPLATKSPSISPLVTPGVPTAHHVVSRQPPQSRSKTVVDTELRI